MSRKSQTGRISLENVNLQKNIYPEHKRTSYRTVIRTHRLKHLSRYFSKDDPQFANKSMREDSVSLHKREFLCFSSFVRNILKLEIPINRHIAWQTVLLLASGVLLGNKKRITCLYVLK